MATARKKAQEATATDTADKAVMTCAEAAAALRITKSTLHYHIRHGRIRRAVIPGAKRAVGIVAADVRAILSPEPNGYQARDIHPATKGGYR
jgi:hypothetical protein